MSAGKRTGGANGWRGEGNDEPRQCTAIGIKDHHCERRDIVSADRCALRSSGANRQRRGRHRDERVEQDRQHVAHAIGDDQIQRAVVAQRSRGQRNGSRRHIEHRRYLEAPRSVAGEQSHVARKDVAARQIRNAVAGEVTDRHSVGRKAGDDV